MILSCKSQLHIDIDTIHLVLFSILQFYFYLCVHLFSSKFITCLDCVSITPVQIQNNAITTRISCSALSITSPFLSSSSALSTNNV